MHGIAFIKSWPQEVLEGFVEINLFLEKKVNRSGITCQPYDF